MNAQEVQEELGRKRKFANLTVERLDTIEEMEAAMAAASDLNSEAIRLRRVAGKYFLGTKKMLDDAEEFGAEMVDPEHVIKEGNPSDFLVEASQVICEMYRALGYLRGKIMSTSTQNQKEEIAKAVGVKAELIGENIIVQAPMLASQWHLATLVNGSYRRWSDAFAEEIKVVVASIVDTLEIDVLKKYKHKTLSYIFCYNANENIKMSDADNKDTKAMTDAILGNLLGRDTGTLCSFYYENCLTPEYPTATFAIVSPGIQNIKTVSDLHGFCPIWNEAHTQDGGITECGGDQY